MCDLTSTIPTIIRSQQISRWVRRDLHKREWNIEIFIRAIDCIVYRRASYYIAEPDLTALCFDAYQHGESSPRPFKLTQSIDPSSTYCVLSLFLDYCEIQQVDAHKLLDEVATQYGTRFSVPIEDVRGQAEWEGVFTPTMWLPDTAKRLMNALILVGFAPLASELEHIL